MHWGPGFASEARVGALVLGAVDPVSGQPELKHTAVRISTVPALWHGFLLVRSPLSTGLPGYWSRRQGNGYHGYQLAGFDDFSTALPRLSCSMGTEGDRIELVDVTGSRYRGAQIHDGRLESCLFIAPRAQQLPGRTWLESLFATSVLSDAERAALLSGRVPQGGREQGAIVCSCFQVGLQTICSVIRAGADSVESIGRACAAGTSCGSCRSELRSLLEREAAPAVRGLRPVARGWAQGSEHG
jgi:assimilatory nitrate reductase catalytic subunit